MDILCFNVVRTAEVFSKLNRKHFKDFKLTLAIARLSKELEDHREFVTNEEKKILLKYYKKNADGTDFLFDEKGVSKIEDPKKLPDLNREMDEFHKNKLEITSIKSKIIIKDVKELNDLTPQDIMVLDPFIEFDVDDDPVEKNTEPQA